MLRKDRCLGKKDIKQGYLTQNEISQKTKKANGLKTLPNGLG